MVPYITQRAEQPIGVFDSGMGGVSVLIKLQKALPGESFLYFGDNANAPYGCKTKEEVTKRAQEITEHLLSQGVKALVIACNTATSASAEILRSKYPDLIIVGMEPAIKPAALALEHPRVLIMATEMTLHLDKFRTLEESLNGKADFELLPCPRLVELVEAGREASPEAEEYLRSVLSPFLNDPPDCVVLGCTHFPFARPLISRILSGRARFFDGGAGTARQLRKRLCEKGLLRTDGGGGTVEFESSSEDGAVIGRMRELYRRFADRDGEL